MSGNFTQTINDSISNITITDDDFTAAISYLNDPNNFRSFSNGLTELMEKCGYVGLNTPEEKTNFLCSKLSAIGIKITKSTIKDWFIDKHRPALDIKSRTIMYQVCYALNASIENIQWFFGRVYFDRTFNCHTVEEAVHYFCFKNNLSYAKALELINKISSFPQSEVNKNFENVFTNDILYRLEHCSDENELLDFFRENKSLFSQWNKTALKYIDKFLSEIRGNHSDKIVIDQVNKGISVLQEDIYNCGLVIQEHLYYLKNNINDMSVAGKTISSTTFMLERILSTHNIPKETIIPNIVKESFPSKKTFSDLLNKGGNTTAYNSIRKCLILLQYYHFWCTYLLHPEMFPKNEYTSSDIHNIYIEETNALLTECGYSELFAGNPYDWLFCYTSANDNPVKGLRQAISCMEYDD